MKQKVDLAAELLSCRSDLSRALEIIAERNVEIANLRAASVLLCKQLAPSSFRFSEGPAEYQINDQGQIFRNGEIVSPPRKDVAPSTITEPLKTVWPGLGPAVQTTPDSERLLILLGQTVRALCNQSGWIERADEIYNLMMPGPPK